MTVSSSVNKVIGSGNGVTTSWPFSFPVLDATHLQVIYTTAAGDESTLSSAVYTVSLNADQDASPGGTVTYSPAIATGTLLTILRQVPYTQATDIKNQGGFFPDVLERAFDLIVMQVQQVKEQLARALKLSPSQAAIGELEATDANRANTFLGFDASGLLTLFTGLASTAVSPAMQPVIAAASLAAARTAMGVAGLADNNAFTGANTAPTPAAGDNDTSLATTAFVQQANSNVLSVNDANCSPAAAERQVIYTAITASRTATLPLASSVRAGYIKEIIDGSGSASQTVAISIARSGSDTIAGSASTQVAINVPRGSCIVMSDGVSAWHVLKWSVVYTAFAAGDVALSNTGQLFVGAGVAQGTLGTWECEGGMTLVATDASQPFNGVLSDGTTTMASARTVSQGANAADAMHLSGRIAAPAANISIYGQSPSTTNAAIKASATGAGRDTYVKVTRVA